MSSRQGAGKKKKPLRKPPFPEIDLNWDGFTLSHLHWVGIKVTNVESKEGRWRAAMALLHEPYHAYLANTPFLLRIKWEMFGLYDIMLTSFEEEKEKIEVPLDHEKPRNELEKKWESIFYLTRESMAIEEALVVRSSLLKAIEERLIDNDGLQLLTEHYKNEYAEDYPFFPVVYNALDSVGCKVGNTASAGLILSVLGTHNPVVAFWDIILRMCKPDPHDPNKFLWMQSDKHTNFLANLSLKDARDTFSLVLNELDKDDSRYRSRLLLDLVAALKQEWCISAKKLDDFGKLVYGTPNTILYMEYNGFSHTFGKYKFSEEVRWGNFSIFFDAVRQQLITGIGLLCPFWSWNYTCCSRENKALLEKVWSCTSDSSCEDWKRMGCLAKDGVAH
jgi:hypothetical protein